MMWAVVNPYDAERIANFICQHQTTDPNTVLGIMNGVVPTLADGSL